ncbi:Meningitis associated and temperature regulated protein B [Raoultella terrigena]|uniref:Common pilus major fimbrillin subunit EcpA n=1 Tax=Raoultella terrigena TaxID=577 RepID=A0A4U9D716_RAOTE|nr:Meningitis associated and temperature regulated protein B [Raoultella terrigena]
MKLKMLAAALMTTLCVGAVQAADVTAQAVATWSATAKKDTTSKLVVTPLGSLAFQYAEGIKGFNSQKGLFDVAIEGDATATAFKLTSRLITNTLTQLDTSGSTLSVGVDYNGESVEKSADTTMIDTANGKLAATSARWLTAITRPAVRPLRMVSTSLSLAAPPTVPRL